MKITENIKQIINCFPRGHVFTYNDFTGKVKGKESLVKALNRLAVSGKIVKLAKGKYYKPEQSPFGNLPPAQYQVVKDLLEDGGKVLGYLTGVSIYNHLGLTTQIGSTIQIGRKEVRTSFKRGKYTIAFVKQKNTINKDNIPTLQVLDALRFIKKIPDSSTRRSCEILRKLIGELPEDELARLVRLAMKYQPSTRALLGAILSDRGQEENAAKLKNSLNPLTSYAIPGISEVLPQADRWNIK